MTTKLVIKRKADGPATPPLAERILGEPLITIGSDATASLRLNGSGVAPEQTVIINDEGQMLLINRAEGTVLNDEPLAREARRPLAHGDRLSIGDYNIFFVSAEAGTVGQTQNQARVTTRLSPLPDQTMPTPAKDSASAQPPAQRETEPRNFAAILDSLRTEEDSFYLLIEGGPRNGQRIRIEAREMPLGWNSTGQEVSFDTASVVAARALLRKDWSGVVVQSLGAGMVAVNGEPVEATRHLGNGDRIVIVPTAITTAQNNVVLVFHEPASLVVLDSLLPQKLPPPVALLEPGAQEGNDAGLALKSQAAKQEAMSRARPKMFSSERTIFGYFTLMEVLLMLAFTLVTAVLIFLGLEYL
jgi:pSer/pThr/pTyr-binding forkhead associated (FHA) protein